MCIWSFRQLQPEIGRNNPDNLAPLVSFTGTEDESGIYMVSVAVEAEGAATIPWMLEALAAEYRKDYAVFTSRLYDVADCVGKLVNLSSRREEECQPHIFHQRIRPLLAGLKPYPESPMVVFYGRNVFKGMQAVALLRAL